MKLQSIILFLIVPLFGLSQNFNVDELIKLRKMSKAEIDVYLNNGEWQYGGLSENQHWWKSYNDMLTLELAYTADDNIIHLLSMNEVINGRIQNQITRYNMREIVRKRTNDGILLEIYEGANYIILLKKVYNDYGKMVTKTSLMRKETFKKSK
jgi:hypothetical protein